MRGEQCPQPLAAGVSGLGWLGAQPTIQTDLLRAPMGAHWAPRPRQGETCCKAGAGPRRASWVMWEALGPSDRLLLLARRQPDGC